MSPRLSSSSANAVSSSSSRTRRGSGGRRSTSSAARASSLPPTSSSATSSLPDSEPFLDPDRERCLDGWPLVVRDGEIGRVAHLTAADEHVLSEDALEPRRECGERGARPLVAGVRLELDTHAAQPLERVLEEEQLRFGVDAGPPDSARVPGPADLESAVLRPERQVAARSDGLAGRPEEDREGHLTSFFRGRERLLEPRGERGGLVPVDAHPAPDLRIGGGAREIVAVLGAERLQHDEPALEPGSWGPPGHRPMRAPRGLGGRGRARRPEVRPPPTRPHPSARMRPARPSRPHSCRSPGTHASTALPREPAVPPSRSERSLPRTISVMWCSSATVASPALQRSPMRPSAGSTTSPSALS